MELKIAEPLTHLAQNTFIGRRGELEILLSLAETVMAGLGRMALVLGEPGIGKTRLIAAWKEKFHNTRRASSLFWVETPASTIDHDLAFHLLRNLLRAIILSIEPGLPEFTPDTVNQVLVDQHAILSPQQASYLKQLLDNPLPLEGEGAAKQLSAKDLQRQYKSAFNDLLICMAQIHPTVIILEDLQWADQSSVNLLAELLPSIIKAPILLCAVARQDLNTKGWRLISSAHDLLEHQLTEIHLKNLNAYESQKFIQQHIAEENLPASVQQAILEKSEGNPFFLKELIHMFIKDGELLQEDPVTFAGQNPDLQNIPNSLQDLVKTRVARLDPAAQIALSVASVIGRYFSMQVLSAVVEEKLPGVPVRELLYKLEADGLVNVEQVNPELVYRFRHVLVHQAVYHSLGQEEKTDLHELVGRKLEYLHQEHIEKAAGQLARHFVKANQPAKAAHYLNVAGQVAMHAYAAVEAESYFKQAIRFTQDEKMLAQLFTDLGLALAHQSRHTDAIASWQLALPLHQAAGKSNQLAKLYAHIARSTWGGIYTEETRRKSLQICLDGLKAVEGAPESADIAYLIHETGRAFAFNLKHDEAKNYSDRALEMAKRLDAYEVQVEALTTIAILPTTEITLGIAFLHEAIRISKENQLYASGARAYNNLSSLTQYLVDFRQAREHRIKAISLAEKSSSSINSIILKQEIIASSLWLGEFEDVNDGLSQIHQLLQEYHNPKDRNKLNMLMLESALKRMQGRFQESEQILDTLIEISRQANEHARVLEATRSKYAMHLEPILLGLEAPSRLNIENILSNVNTAIREKQDFPFQTISSAQCLLSTLYAVNGDYSEAEAALKKAETKVDDIKSFIQILWQLAKYNLPYTLLALQRPNQELITLTKARLEAARQNYTQAVQQYVDCIETLNKQEGKWWEAIAKLELGTVYLKRKDPEDIDLAQAAFREARILFDQMNLEHYVGVAIDKLRQVKMEARAQVQAHIKLNFELAEASKIQSSLIPSLPPTIDGLDVSGMLLPAREMSGDFYDFYQLDNNRLGVVIADVADKGLGAALYMAMSRTLIRTYAVETQLPLKETLHEVNRRLLSDTPNGIFLTAFLGEFDPETGGLTYVNAGHNPPYLLSKTNGKVTITPLERTGPLAGVFPEASWEARETPFEPGDTLVLYTDGITEAQNDDSLYFGQQLFKESLVNNYGLPAEAYRNAVLQNVLSFTGNSPRLDDITITIIKNDHQA